MEGNNLVPALNQSNLSNDNVRIWGYKVHKTASMHGFMLAIIANNCPNVNTLKHNNTNVNTHTLTGDSIPERLRNIPDAPARLFYKGTSPIDLIGSTVIAIVGSRKVDTYGVHVTKTLASGLAERGFVIVSGLALGVDALAHKAALEAKAKTIAVLPCGIGTLYPRTNSQLGDQIMANGCLISEYEGDYTPHEYDFLIRNRIVSGLADVVIITQAAARSGSLNTARHALEQGRTVMAVPGPITNPLCEGTNNLLKMGALPVTSVVDVLHALGMSTDKEMKKDYDLLARNEQELHVIQLLQEGVSDAETIRARLKFSAQELNVHLTMLEIRGIITPLGANNWALK